MRCLRCFSCSVVDYVSGEVPVQVHLEAFNPCIPLDSKSSGIPAIIFNYTVTNTTSKAVKVGGRNWQ